MSLFAITFRLDGDDGRRLRALDRAVHTLSPSTLIYNEVEGFYLVRADATSQEVLERLAAAAQLNPKRDLLLVINLSHPEYVALGSQAGERLKALMAGR